MPHIAIKTGKSNLLKRNNVQTLNIVVAKTMSKGRKTKQETMKL